MSENSTRNLHDNGSFEERVLAELKTMGSQFGNMESALGNVETHLGNAESTLGNVETQVGNVETQVGNMETQLGKLENTLGNVEGRLEKFDVRLSTMETRFTALEEKVDARLRETRPIWENVQQKLTEIELALGLLNRQFRTLVNDSFNLRSRVEKLEDNQSAA